MSKEIIISSKKLKLLVFSHSSEIGGGELSMLDFFDYWTSVNNQLELLFIIKFPEDRLGSELAKRGWGYRVLDYSSWSGPRFSFQPEDLYRNAKRNTEAVLAIDEIIQEFRPDMVATNTIVTPWAAFAAKLNGLPHIWFVREYGDIDHGHTFEMGREQTFEDVGMLSELVVTNSLALKSHVAQYVPPDKVATLYTPFKIKKIEELAKEEIKSPFTNKADLRTVMAGVLRISKGQEKVIEAIAKLKKRNINVELCVIGDSSEAGYKAKLKRKASKLGVGKNIHFVGKQRNPYSFMATADVGIMASTMEAFGRVTFEYLCLGKPVIGAATGGTLEMVKDGKNGFLFDVDSVDQIADRLEVYANDANLLKNHQSAAKNSATDIISGEYGAEALVKKIVEISKQKEVYKLPNFTRRWLNLPQVTEAIKPRSGILHKVRLARELGPRETYAKAKKYLKAKRKRRGI